MKIHASAQTGSNEPSARKIGDRHGERHEEKLTDDPCLLDGLSEIQRFDGRGLLRRRRLGLGRLGRSAALLLSEVLDHPSEEVLDVDHADQVVQSLAIDRHAGVVGFGKAKHQFVKGGRLFDRYNIDARHHHVVD